MKKVIICIGLPGSGKSTWARAYQKEHQNVLILNRDSIRIMLGSTWNAKHEEIVKTIEAAALRVILTSNEDCTVIIDDTNMNMKTLNSLLGICRQCNTTDISLQSFLDVSISKCIEQDSLRENPVGEKMIIEMGKKVYEVRKLLNI